MRFFSLFRRKKPRSFKETVARMLDQNTNAEISQYIKKQMESLRPSHLKEYYERDTRHKAWENNGNPFPVFVNTTLVRWSVITGPESLYELVHLGTILFLIESEADDCLVQDILREYGLLAFEVDKKPIQKYIHRQIINNNEDFINLFDNTKKGKEETHRDYIINHPEFISSRDIPSTDREQLRTGTKPGKLLHHAVFENHPKLVQDLIDAGANVNVLSNRRDESPLHVAARIGNPKIINMLVNAGADVGANATVNKKNIGSRTPLFLAVEFDNADAVEALLNHGADPQTRTENGCPVICYAVQKGLLEVVKKLLKGGAKVSDRWAGAPLGYAITHGHVEILRELLKSIDKNDPNLDHELPYYVAVKVGRVDLLKMLLDSDKLQTSQATFTKTLNSAAREGRYGMVKFLRDYKTQRRKLTYKRTTFDPRLFCDESPLHFAARYGYLKDVNALLEKGVQVDSINSKGETPLFLAAQFGHLGVVEALFAKGADKLIAANDGYTPQGMANIRRDREILEAYRDAPENYYNNMPHEVQDSTAVKQTATINPSGFFDESPLHSAAQKGRLDEVKALLAKGADKDSRNARGQTPLYIAAKEGHLGVVNALLAEGADKTIAANDGATPQRVATYSEAPYRAKKEIIRVLFNAPANIDETITMTRIESPPYIYRKAPL